MQRKKLLAILIGVIIVVAGIGVYLFQQPSEPTTEEERLLRITIDFPTDADPAIGSDLSSTWAYVWAYDTLVYPDPEGGVKPWLAKTWEISENGTVFTFHLRQGVTFHSGNELTAEDVLFSMKRLKEIGQGYSYIFGAVNVNDSRVVDDYTVEFHLKRTFGPFVSSLVRLYVLDKETVMDHLKTPGEYGEYGDYGREWLANNDAGCGPYKLTDIERTQYANYKLYENYWKDLPEKVPTKIIERQTPETSTVVTEMNKKEIEIGPWYLPSSIVDSINDTEGIDIGEIPGGGLLYYMLHSQKEPTDDVHVRIAMAYAMDYKRVREEAVLGQGQARSCLGSELFGSADLLGDGILAGRDQNISKAEAELEKSKYWPEIQDMEITLEWTAEAPVEKDVALLFKKCMEDIGLTVNVVKTPWGNIVTESHSKEKCPPITTIYVSPSYPEAGSLLDSRFHSANMKSWEQNEWLNNSTIDSMIESALGTPDRSERQNKYQEIQRTLFRDHYPCLNMFESTSLYPYQESYMDWPQGEEKNLTGVMGYDIDPRTIQIYPEKKAQSQTTQNLNNLVDLLSFHENSFHTTATLPSFPLNAPRMQPKRVTHFSCISFQNKRYYS